jgi:hypothetical protein
MGKVCSKCKIDKDKSEFYKLSESKDGLRPECKQCHKIRIIKEILPNGYQRCIKCGIVKENTEYHKDNKRKNGIMGWCKECRSTYYKNDPKRQIRHNRYRSKNKEKILQYNKEYHLKNRDTLNEKKRISALLPENKRKKNNKRNQRKKIDIEYKLECNLRTRMYKAIKKGYKSGSTIKDLGCSITELKVWIENQFVDGMCWENWGCGMDKWNIDHIIPLYKVNLSDREEFLKVCHYTNLRPLWQIDNMNRTYEEFGKNLEKAS